jgi:tetratricopeptide (TPR) repeat protein
LLLPVPPARSSRSRPWRIGRALVALLLVIATAGVGLWGLAAVAWGRSQSAIQAGDRAASIDALELAAALDPAFGLYARELGKLLLAEGDADRGLRLLAASAAGDPGDPNPVRALGVAALREGRIAEAERDFQTAIRLDATRTPSRILLGMALDAARRSAEADREYAKVIMASPLLALSDGWDAIGVESSRLTAVTEEALGIAAREPAAAFQHAQLLSVLGRRSELRELLQMVDVPAGGSLLAVAEAEAGDGAEARRLLETTSADGRRYAPYWTNRAQVMALLDEPAEVDRSYRFAKRLSEAVEAVTADPGLTPAIGRDANDFWMYQRSTAWFEDRSWPEMPSAARGVWLRIHEPDRIELDRSPPGG